MSRNVDQQFQQEESLDWSAAIQKCQLLYEKETRLGQLTDETKFAYGSTLVKSSEAEDKQQGYSILKELVKAHPDSREYLFFAAVGAYKLEEYSEARKFIDRLIEIEPSNRQAKDLQAAVHSKIATDGLIGMAITGGAVATAALVGFLLAKGIKR